MKRNPILRSGISLSMQKQKFCKGPSLFLSPLEHPPPPVDHMPHIVCTNLYFARVPSGKEYMCLLNDESLSVHYKRGYGIDYIYTGVDVFNEVTIDKSSNMITITVGVPSYRYRTETHDNGKWLISFHLDLPSVSEKIVPCESVFIADDGWRLSMEEDSMLKMLNGDRICFPKVLTLSGDLALLLQDMSRHPEFYDKKKRHHSVTLSFQTCFAVLMDTDTCALYSKGETKCLVTAEILMMFSALMDLSSTNLDPAMRYEHRDFISLCRGDTKRKHTCVSFSMKSDVLPLKDICSIKVSGLLKTGTDYNDVMCSPETVSLLELPWCLREDLMSERCCCFQPIEVAKVHPSWKIETIDGDVLRNVSVCRYAGETDTHCLVETLVGNFRMCLKRGTFMQLRAIMRSDRCSCGRWVTETVSGERLEIAVVSDRGECYFYLLTNVNQVMQLRQIFVNKDLQKTIIEMSLT